MYKFNVTIARQETKVYEFEVEAKNEHEAEELAKAMFSNCDMDNDGDVVVSDEWVQEIDCEDENYGFVEDEEEVE